LELLNLSQILVDRDTIFFTNEIYILAQKIKFINMCRILWCGVNFYIALLCLIFYYGACTWSFHLFTGTHSPCDICSICRLTKHYLLIFLPNRIVFHWEVYVQNFVDTINLSVKHNERIYIKPSWSDDKSHLEILGLSKVWLL
jgi:hypothetical protein